MTDESPMQGMAERLKSARSRHFKSAAAAARHLGMKEVTVRAHESGQNGVPIDVMLKYAKAYGVDFIWLTTGFGSTEEYDSWLQDPNRPRDPADPGPRLVPIVGVAEVGAWREMAEEPEPIGEAAFYDPNPYVTREAYAFAVAGRTDDVIFPTGSIVFVKPADESGPIGDFFVVRRQRSDLFETSIVEVGEEAGQALLHQRAAPPGRAQTLKYKDLQGREDFPVPVGWVVGVYRPLPSSDRPNVRISPPAT